MPRYYFSISNDRSYDDNDGLDLPDVTAARSEAAGFARDLRRMEPTRRDWSNWAVRVTDADRNLVFDLSFLDAAKQPPDR